MLMQLLIQDRDQLHEHALPARRPAPPAAVPIPLFDVAVPAVASPAGRAWPGVTALGYCRSAPPRP